MLTITLLLRVIFVLSTIVSGADCCSSRILLIKEETERFVRQRQYQQQQQQQQQFEQHAHSINRQQQNNLDKVNKIVLDFKSRFLSDLQNETAFKEERKIVGTQYSNIAAINTTGKTKVYKKSKETTANSLSSVRYRGQKSSLSPLTNDNFDKENHYDDKKDDDDGSSDDKSNDKSDGVSYDESDRVSDDESDGVSDDESDRVSDDESDRVSDDESDRVSDDESDHVSDDESDRVSDDEFITDPAIRERYAGDPKYHVIDMYYSIMRDVLSFECSPPFATDFCLNGRCFRYPIGNHSFYSCECSDGYVGERCESKNINDLLYIPEEGLLLAKHSLPQPKVRMARIVFSFPTLIILSLLYVIMAGHLVYQRPRPVTHYFLRGDGIEEFCLDLKV